MTIIETKVYTFDELSDKAKENARSWYLGDGFDDDWRENTYEDAKNIGVKIVTFDLRARRIELIFEKTALSIYQTIREEHGPTCHTYIVALKFFAGYSAARLLHGEDFEESEYYLDEVVDTFDKDLGECYLKMLDADLEYFQSDEYVNETILSNEYTFTENGHRFG